MAIGKNVPLGDDKLVKKTTGKGSKADTTSNVNNTRKLGEPSRDPKASTYETEKMTFYVKKDLLEKLHNFSYWERHSITDAINIVLADGLKGKKTKPKEG